MRSAFEVALSCGAFDSGGCAGAYGAIERTLVDGLDACVAESELRSRFADDVSDLLAELVGHGAVEADVDAFRFGRKDLDEDVAGFQGAGLCLLHGHAVNSFQVEDVRFTLVEARRSVCALLRHCGKTMPFFAHTKFKCAFF